MFLPPAGRDRRRGVLAPSPGCADLVPGWCPGWEPAGRARPALIVLSVARHVGASPGSTSATPSSPQAQQEIAELAVAEERARFARDLHDILGHSLTVLAVKAELAGRLVRIDADRAAAEIAEVERLARDALADVRSAVGGYREGHAGRRAGQRPAALDAAGIEADLPAAVDACRRSGEELFGWAVREGVTNVVRHSGARPAADPARPGRVEITDDGRGPAPTPDRRPGRRRQARRQRPGRAARNGPRRWAPA